MAKFGIITLLVCTFFIPLMLTNSPAQAVTSQPTTTATTVVATTGDCSIDPKFVVSAGQTKTDNSFGVKTGQPGVDAKFGVKICQGVSDTSPDPTAGK